MKEANHTNYIVKVGFFQSGFHFFFSWEICIPQRRSALSVQSGILSRYLSALPAEGETGKEGDGEGGSADSEKG